MTHDGEPDSYEYASRLATWIWEKHYKNESPHWKPLNDLLGVLTQIDNMVTGLVRAQPEQEPVAWAESDEDGEIAWRKEICFSDDPQWLDYPMPLYTAPPQRERILCGCGDQIMPDDGAECGTCVTARNAVKREWQGLTDEEYESMAEKYVTNYFFDTLKYARAIETKLRVKNGNV